MYSYEFLSEKVPIIDCFISNKWNLKTSKDLGVLFDSMSSFNSHVLAFKNNAVILSSVLLLLKYFTGR